jgi:diguanylate cyclase (GGDEF)-like protein/PAS domain S-box-containing protein
VTQSAILILSTLTAALGSGALVWLGARGELGRLRRVQVAGDAIVALPRAVPAVSGIDGAEMGFYRLILDHTSDVLLRFDANGRCVFVSPSCREVFGYTSGELRPSPASRLVHPGDRLEAHLGEPGPAKSSWRAVHRDGQTLWIEASYHATEADGGSVAILRDVTQRKHAEDRLLDARKQWARMASIDPLSGLPNRDAFLGTAGDGGKMALLVINLDRFRPINDTHGHAAGDAVLRDIATRLKRELAPEPILARLGGDAFGVLMRVPDGDAGIAAHARDLIKTIGEPVRFEGTNFTVGAAIGISVCPRDGTSTETLLRNAEIAITRAKQTGGGTYRFYEPAMGEAMEQAAELKRELPAAIRDGRIVPWFQPILRLEDMRLVAFEALARWEHPAHGVLEPALFLPLAEEIGASTTLFASLLGQACRTAHEWPDDVRLTVNLSPRELHDESLPATVARILAAVSFDGARLEIEITEQLLILDPEVARRVLDGLRTLGLGVALDDFGTGLSSLYHLRELPFDKVKIDRSFMRVLATDAECARFVAAIIGLGQALGLELTAEGIEDEAALARLRELGCTYGQGNLLGRPMPASSMPRGLFRGLV